MKTIEYKKSFKKMAITATTAMVIIISQLFILDLTNNVQFYAWLSLSLVLFIGVSFILKKQATAKCPYCNADLFEVIENIKSKHLSFNYCPVCGNRVTLSTQEQVNKK